jgi:hypothetical protein
MGLVTIIYCLRFETSLFVASYDSQGYGGGIRPRLHTGAVSFLLDSSLSRFLEDWIDNTLYKGYNSVVVMQRSHCLLCVV